MKKYIYLIKRGKKYYLISVIYLFVAINFSCISVPPQAPRAEIIFENLSYSGLINGNIDFAGLQIYRFPASYNGQPLYIEKKEKSFLNYSDAVRNNFIYKGFNGYDKKDILLLFISKLDAALQNKLHVLKQLNVVPQSNHTGYQQILYREQKSIYDEWNPAIVNAGGPGKMDNECISYLKKNSNADYFLIISIRPLEVKLADEESLTSSMTIALLGTLYDKNGNKVYCKIYKEQLEGIKAPDKEGPYYNCSRKLLEHYGDQINRDLSFILGANDAEKPTLADLYQELNQNNK